MAKHINREQQFFFDNNNRKTNQNINKQESRYGDRVDDRFDYF